MKVNSTLGHFKNHSQLRFTLWRLSLKLRQRAILLLLKYHFSLMINCFCSYLWYMNNVRALEPPKSCISDLILRHLINRCWFVCPLILLCAKSPNVKVKDHETCSARFKGKHSLGEKITHSTKLGQIDHNTASEA